MEEDLRGEGAGVRVFERGGEELVLKRTCDKGVRER